MATENVGQSRIKYIGRGEADFFEMKLMRVGVLLTAFLRRMFTFCNHL
jgi:hypothetical protein